jgi:uncharacterized protein YfiM (DUF2279 family)
MRWVFLLILLPFLLLAGLFFVVTDAKPGLERSVHVSMADLDRGKAIVDSLGLQHMREGEIRQLALSESDLDKGVNYLAHRLGKGSGSVQIALSQVTVRVSLLLPLPIALPAHGAGRFLNIKLVLAQADDMLKAAQLRVGSLPLPAKLAGKLVVWGVLRSPFGADLAAARSMLNSARISQQTLALRFTWRGSEMQKRMANGAAYGVDEAVLAVYREHLSRGVGLAGDKRAAGKLDFALLLGSAFTLAQQRSGQNDPVIENRAAITSLAEMALGGRLLSRRGVVNPNRRTGLLLAGREDTSQHFALSAFIAATGGEGLSEMAGLYKELSDAHAGGSGFSFNDLAADRAGSRFGQACTSSRAAALKVQARLAGVRDANVFLPAIDDLPESMQQAEFERRFGGVGQPAYQKMLRQIEARIAKTPLYAE